MNSPILSIVIANYNYGRYLGHAIESIIGQKVGHAVELIICDGGSSDESVQVIRKYAGGLPPNTMLQDWIEYQQESEADMNCIVNWWCSEKDGGQSAAFNKGFRHARGLWVTWLNADEIYAEGALRAVLAIIKKCPNAKWITANDCLFDDDTNVIRKINWGPHFQFSVFKKNRAIAAAFGPSSFFKKELLDLVGGIDESLHYTMDSCLWASFCMQGIVQTRVNKICWKCRIQKGSKTFGVKSEQSVARRNHEECYWRNKIGYTYVPGKKNLWYVLWIVGRLLDFSLIVRFYKKMKYEGRKLSDVDL